MSIERVPFEHYNKYNKPGAIEKLLLLKENSGFPVDEVWCKNLYDYPLDLFRIQGNQSGKSQKQSGHPF